MHFDQRERFRMATPAIVSTNSLLETRFKKHSPGAIGMLIFILLLIGGLLYIGFHLSSDLAVVHSTSVLPFVLLGIALLMALGFEFVNGFHDTANAVATVIYTHSLEPTLAVVFSGVMNFAGVLASSGAVAFSIVSLLPVGRSASGSGLPMIFALLVAAILWNLTTWWKGLPASSSHTMIGSILGVGVANHLMQGSNSVAGVDWGQAVKVFRALLWSPIIGFAMAAIIFFLFKILARDHRLYKAPEGTAPPPLWIRTLLIGTCGGVSFFHGSNDGQKGMGLIMLILVGTVPTAYSLHHIPIWVKVAVALALGLGTMIGWKRIVITVGEKIGKTNLTYAQGASAQITAMITIWMANNLGLPVSTTQVLSSGIAGTMAANGSGLRWTTIRDIALVWVVTLPAAALLSGGLFWVFQRIS